MKFNRRSNNFISDWWWKIDKISLILIFAICFIGSVVVATSSISVAERIGNSSFFFVKKQLLFVFMALLIIVGVSFLKAQTIMKLSWLGFFISLAAMFFVILFGNEVNGAKRWMSIVGQSVQPSEFVKPFFVVITAWLIAQIKLKRKSKYLYLSISYYLVVATSLILQPDFGMFCIISAIWASQLFLGGLKTIWVMSITLFLVIFLSVSYFFFPHFASRIDSYLNPDSKKNYQVSKSIDSFENGGLFGQGPGEGVVKRNLPDSHTDFVFAVIGEEFGAISCIVILMLYILIVIRGLNRVTKEDNLFTVLAVSGLLLQFGIQAIINIGVSLNLLPTKGMTLPLISYGGSSILAISLTLGMALALSKRKYGISSNDYKLMWNNIND